jgi:hypothetical protein
MDSATPARLTDTARDCVHGGGAACRYGVTMTLMRTASLAVFALTTVAIAALAHAADMLEPIQLRASRG